MVVLTPFWKSGYVARRRSSTLLSSSPSFGMGHSTERWRTDTRDAVPVCMFPPARANAVKLLTIAESSSGRTAGVGPANVGSNPTSASFAPLVKWISRESSKL